MFDPSLYGHDGSKAFVDTQAPAGDILGQLALGAVGNVAGQAVNMGANAVLQHQQFENQKALQDRAFMHNQVAAAMQPRIQALGMQNAGLSAAGVNGSGAPALQAGAAAGASSQMTNVFSGLAELVAAIKAPTEIEKSVAETELARAETSKTGAETEQLIPAQVSNLLSGAGLVAQQVRAARNANDVFEAQKNFAEDNGASIFDGYRGMLKQNGVFEKLPPRTRDTIDKLADGEIDVGLGEIQALQQIVDAQANLSERDKQLFTNLIETATAMSQIKDKSVMAAYEKLPVNQQNLMRAQISEYYAMANQAKTQADLNKLHKWLEEHSSDQWLIEHGMSDEIERKKYVELFNQVLHFPSAVMNATPFLLGTAVGRSVPSAPPPPNDSRGLYQYFR